MVSSTTVALLEELLAKTKAKSLDSLQTNVQLPQDLITSSLK